jgi:hypothetical protein
MNNGWIKIERQNGRAGAYDKYRNQIVVIVPKEKNPITLAVSMACYEALGKPKRVDLFQRGTNIALCPSEDGFRVFNRLNKSLDNLNAMYVSVQAWRKKTLLRPGVYQAHIENGMIVFDTAQMPTVL